MTDPLELVRSSVRRHRLWHSRTRILAAVSGGSDSVAMFLLLHALARAGEVELAGLAHLNHQVRLGAADADEAFCRALAARVEVPAVFAHADVPALARQHRQSIEVAGRRARHRALVEAAATLGAERIATAHTRDDQAETVLLHLMRGAGVGGGRGIAPASGAFVRPVLDCTRAELRTWLTAHGESWCEDETNADISNPRNRVRHVLLPELRQQFNPAVDGALVRFADILREDHAYLNEVAAEAAARLVSRRTNDKSSAGKTADVTIDGAGLAELPRALGRRVVRIALETVDPKRSYDLEEVDTIVEACGESGSLRRDLPGVRMERSGRFVVLVHRDPTRVAPERFHYELPVPGRVAIEESACELEAEGPFDFAQDRPSDAVQPADMKDSPHQAVVQADELGDGLVVRSRREGDRLRVWRVGRKKLQDLFVDRKVDRFERDRVPIVTDRTGRIVWVAGHAVGEEFHVGPLTNRVVILRLRPL